MRAAERIAQAFHESYERQAPDHGYETRKRSAVPWADVPEDNKSLMIAVVEDLIGTGVIAYGVPRPRPDYITGTGQKLYGVHSPSVCEGTGCVIHNPTDPHQDWPTHFVETGLRMMRQCPHGVLHPDKDDTEFRNRGVSPLYPPLPDVHDCDGCCDA